VKHGINPNQDNSSITIKPYKWRKGFYVADTLRDRDLIRWLGFNSCLSSADIDKLLSVASTNGFDIREVI